MDRKFLRPGWIVGHLLVVLAALVCLRLGRWQWHRMHEGGTIQNFGYAVLWPVFGAAFIYMWFRFLQLEKLKDAEDDAELTALAAGTPSAPATSEPADHTAAARAAGSSIAAAPVGDEPPAAPPELPARAGRSGQVGFLADEGTARPDIAEDGIGRPEPTHPRVSRTTPSTGVTVAVATVGDDDPDDPELAAYNRALAALAEKDHRRAR